MEKYSYWVNIKRGQVGVGESVRGRVDFNPFVTLLKAANMHFYSYLAQKWMTHSMPLREVKTVELVNQLLNKFIQIFWNFDFINYFLY